MQWFVQDNLERRQELSKVLTIGLEFRLGHLERPRQRDVRPKQGSAKHAREVGDRMTQQLMCGSRRLEPEMV